MDSTHYINQLNHKDQTIQELINRLENMPMQQQQPTFAKEIIYQGHAETVNAHANTGFSMDGQRQPTDRERQLEDAKNYLEDMLRAKDNQIEEMHIELSRKPAIEVVRERQSYQMDMPVTNKPPIREVVYERDPYLIERNKQLKEELENALLSEQKAHAECSMKIEEIGRLQCLIEDLKSMPPKQIRVEIPYEHRITVTARIGPSIEKYLALYEKNNNKKCQALGFAALYYYKNFRQYLRMSHKRKEKVIVNQTIQVYDGTQEICNFYRQSLVKWLFDIFVRSTDRAFSKKMNSFILFKSNMEELRENLNDVIFIMVAVYNRLKNLCRESMPTISWDEKYTIPSNLPTDHFMDLDHTVMKFTKDKSKRDNTNQWIENTICYVILRKKFDRVDKDKVIFS